MAAIAVVAIVFILAYAFLGDHCDITRAQADAKVFDFLKREGLSADKLTFVSRVDTCPFEYEYVDQDKHYSFSVIDDPIHGIELGRYDHSQDPQP